MMAKINKNVATLLQHLQYIMLCIYQYRVQIIYKPDPELCIVEWLFENNHTDNRNQKIIGMNVNMHTISTLVDISICTSIEDKQVATQLDEDLQRLKSSITQDKPHKKDGAEQSMKDYWPIRH